IFNVWFAININIITWFTGFLGIEFGLSLKDAVIAIVIGNLLGAVFLALTSAMGPKTGVPQIVSGRNAFGSRGNWMMALINWFANMGWFAVDILLAVFALQRLTGIPYLPALFGLTLLTIVVAVYGYNFIHAFAKIMTGLLGVLFVFMTFAEIKTVDVNWLAHSPQLDGFAYWGMLALAAAVAFSYQISFCPIGADYSRYLSPQLSSKKVWLATFAASLTVGIWLEILGAVMATMGQGDPMALMEKVMGVFAVPALITVIVSTFPVNAIAIYSGGLSALAMGIPLKRRTVARDYFGRPLSRSQVKAGGDLSLAMGRNYRVFYRPSPLCAFYEFGSLYGFRG
ncbi:MAG: purine-cytosine permease family protein, partial [Candidatus Aquicultor sp.]